MNSDQTVLFVSHNLNTLKELCPRTMYIENGVTRMVGETEDVIQQYLDTLNQG